MSSRMFPNGTTLREAKEALIGVRIICATGAADGVPHPDLVCAYQILNVTSESLVVAPVINFAFYGPERLAPRLDKKSSVLISTGVKRHKYPKDIVIFMHPEQLARLHSLLGVDDSKAWRRPTQETA